MSDCKHYKKTDGNDSDESAKNHIPASGRASDVETKQATVQTTAARDATESPAETGERTAAVGLLPKQAPEVAGRSAALFSSGRKGSKFQEDRQGSY